MISIRQYRRALLYLKYTPVIMFIVMLIHIILALFNINFGIADTIVGCAILPSLLILSLTNIFNFCALHKALTIYSLIIDLCINFHKYIGFGILLKPIQFTLSIFGIVIAICFLFKLKFYIKHGVRLREL